MRGVPSFDTLDKKVKQLAANWGASRVDWGIEDGRERPLYVEFWGVTKAGTMSGDGHHREEFLLKTELNSYLNNKLKWSTK